MKLFAITFGDSTAPSTRWRLLNYAPLHKATGDAFESVSKRDLRFSHLRHCRQADVVINQKCLLPVAWGWLIRAFAKKLVFEFDDALWLRQGRPYNALTQWRVDSRLHWWLSRADEVSCTNEYLAAYARRYARRVHIIPTGLALSQPEPSPRTLPSDARFILGWSGSASSLQYLEARQEPLANFLNKYPRARLRVMCNKRPVLHLPFEYTPWSPQAESGFFSRLTVGLVPLDFSDEFAKGKYSITALLFMSHGVPIVGNMSQGGPAEIASHGGVMVAESDADWLASLEKLTNEEVYATYSEAALRSVRENYDIRKTFALWREILSTKRGKASIATLR
jgi:glycosyltransferase involved in cell wall biosynthesis